MALRSADTRARDERVRSPLPAGGDSGARGHGTEGRLPRRGAPEGAGGMRLAIVAAQFNAEVTDRMVESALEQAKDRNVRVSTVVRVPGAFEIPLAVQALLRRDDVDAGVAIGAVIKGEPLHDEAIMAAVCPALLELGLRESKPVGLGITGPGVTDEQAMERSRNAAPAVGSVVAMYELMNGLLVR